MFDKVSEVDQVSYDLRFADYIRSLNRARINSLFNGASPYTAQEAAENHVKINVNDLSSTVLGHDARAQFYQAFLKPGNYFNCKTDAGPKHKRNKWNQVVTAQVSKPMKRSMEYYEKHRATFAQDVLHGIGPGSWEDRDTWCPDPKAIEDVLIPSKTLITMKNLVMFDLPRSYTAIQLKKMTGGAKRDPAWNMDLVDRCLRWMDKEATMLTGNQFSEYWKPESLEERIKGDGCIYATDQVPTIDVHDFYFWDDTGKTAGWRRRIILDAWSEPTSSGGVTTMARRGSDHPSNYKPNDDGDMFLYNPGDRKYADDWREIVSFQFADLSAVAPFQYHSVRSLGFLLYALCHLQNRMWCKFNEAVFESLLQYFQVNSLDDAQRALKIELANMGIFDQTLKPMPAAERWQVNANLVELGMRENQARIQNNSASYMQNKNFSQDRTEKTKFQVMAEVQSATAMISGALQQAYAYQKAEYYEIFRRFCRKNSRDPEVRTFRLNCLRAGVPEQYLQPEAWEIEPERVIGAGNKTLELAIAEQLMQFRPLYDPEAQRTILRDVTLAITDDPARADTLVPDQPHISDSVHDTELAFGSLMQGSAVTPKPGLNSVEVAGTMLKLMAGKVQQIMQTGGVGTPQDVVGLQLAAQYTTAFIGMLAQDPQSKPIVKQLGDVLGKIMNEVKAMQQRQQEAAQQQNGHAQMDPKDQAKIQAMILQAQTKASLAKDSHAQRTAQRQIQFQQKQLQDAEKTQAEIRRDDQLHKLETSKSIREHKANLLKTDLEGAANIRRNRLKSTE